MNKMYFYAFISTLPNMHIANTKPLPWNPEVTGPCKFKAGSKSKLFLIWKVTILDWN